MADKLECELVDKSFLDEISLLEEAAQEGKKRSRERLAANDQNHMEITNDDDVFSSEADHGPKKKTQNRMRNFLGLKEGEQREPWSNPRPNAEQDGHPHIEELENGDVEELSPIPESQRADFEHVVTAGMRLKVIASVFLGRLDEKANIFFPSFRAEVVDENGKARVVTGFLKSPKDQILVFASGGTGRIWEKTVSRVYEIFFGRKIKIIRESWLRKHGGSVDLTRRNSHHSESFFDIFTRLNGLSSLSPQITDWDTISRLDLFCFSWWDVCDECFEDLSSLASYLKRRISATHFHVASRRRYSHSIRNNDILSSFCVSGTEEKTAWKEVWWKVQEYASRDFPSDEEKEKFWTKSVEGLEICKWIGQAFVENKHDVLGTRLSVKDGDFLKHYEEFTREDPKCLSDLIEYLTEKNWDLSCWYSHHVPHNLQKSWKKNWHHIVVPHFSWSLVAQFEDDCGDNICEMCGHEDITTLYWLYHPKFKLSQEFFGLPEEDQTRTEKDYGFSLETKFEALLPHFQKARRQSLVVGSKCQKVLQASRQDLDEWRKKHSAKDLKRKKHSVNENQEQYSRLEVAEAEQLLGWLRENVTPGGTVTTRRITKELVCEAVDVKNQMRYLERKGWIVKEKGGVYRLREGSNHQ